ncbi:SRPBCC family protein [Streptomyces sp. NPDC046203]|uniref:SRPBCC family protein n=1 Tax=Streptomyces sp. NPDC046203 TaxID=3154602 RepID=UPI0033D298FA
MSRIDTTVDISRRPDEVFRYVTDAAHLPEWQESVVAGRTTRGTPGSVGSQAVITRRIGNRDFTATMRTVAADPPYSWHIHGVEGPVRGDLRGTLEPLDGGERSRLTLSLDFEGHGFGKVIAPLVARPAARKEMPRDQRHLKNILEHGTRAPDG